MTQRLSVTWTGFTKFSFLNQNFLKEKCRLGGDLRRSKQLPDQILVAWDLDWLVAKWKTKVRQREDWEKLTSLIQGLRTPGNQKRKQKIRVPMEKAVLCQMGTRKRQKGSRRKLRQEGSQNPMERQSMHVSRQRMNPRESVWNPLILEIMKITTRKEDWMRWITKSSKKCFRCSWRCPDANSVGQNMWRARKTWFWQHGKRKSTLYIDGHLSSVKWKNWNQPIKSTIGLVVLQETLWKTTQIHSHRLRRPMTGAKVLGRQWLQSQIFRFRSDQNRKIFNLMRDSLVFF